MASGGLNCIGKEVFFLALQTASPGGACFNVIAWIHVYTPLMHHRENTNATQHTKAYDTKAINIALGGILWVAGSDLFNSFA